MGEGWPSWWEAGSQLRRKDGASQQHSGSLTPPTPQRFNGMVVGWQCGACIREGGTVRSQLAIGACIPPLASQIVDSNDSLSADCPRDRSATSAQSRHKHWQSTSWHHSWTSSKQVMGWSGGATMVLGKPPWSPCHSHLPLWEILKYPAARCALINCAKLAQED